MQLITVEPPLKSPPLLNYVPSGPHGQSRQIEEKNTKKNTEKAKMATLSSIRYPCAKCQRPYKLLSSKLRHERTHCKARQNQVIANDVTSSKSKKRSNPAKRLTSSTTVNPSGRADTHKTSAPSGASALSRLGVSSNGLQMATVASHGRSAFTALSHDQQSPLCTNATMPPRQRADQAVERNTADTSL